jgi:hypothetical protein
MERACMSSASPKIVGETPRAVRSNTGTPIMDSSRAVERIKDGCDMLRTSASLLIYPYSATLSRPSM